MKRHITLLITILLLSISVSAQQKASSPSPCTFSGVNLTREEAYEVDTSLAVIRFAFEGKEIRYNDVNVKDRSAIDAVDTLISMAKQMGNQKASRCLTQLRKTILSLPPVQVVYAQDRALQKRTPAEIKKCKETVMIGLGRWVRPVWGKKVKTQAELLKECEN